MMTTLKVLILEGHHGVRDALERRLRRLPGVQVVAAVSEPDTAFHMILDAAPDVVLCDPRSVGGTPLETLRRLRAAGRAVVVLTTSVIGADVSNFVGAGATSVLLKGCSMDAIFSALRAAVPERGPVAPESGSAYCALPRAAAPAHHAFAK